MSITSYAQNFEDVMLWRALGHIERGSYIDIGAQDPVIDSVSLAFHEHGWQGIHVEPTPHYAELLRQQRPGDTVIQAAVGTGPAILRFFEIPDTGISTADVRIAGQHRDRGFDVREITVPCVALLAIFESCVMPEIHWLKIDVEGFEEQVLTSWGENSTRPWIVVVESTLPLTQIETHESWEGILFNYGYTPVYFDGLNRYYVSAAHPELKNAFSAPPNVFDGFTINGTASAPLHTVIVARYQEKINEVVAQAEQQRQSITNEVERLTSSLVTLDQAHSENEQNWMRREQELTAQIQSAQQQILMEKAELTRSHDEREQTLNQQLHAKQNEIDRLMQELLRLEQEKAQREKELLERAREVRQENERLLRTLIEREREVAAQVAAITQQAASNRDEQIRQHSEQERALRKEHAQKIHAIQQDLRRMEQERVQREREYSNQISESRREQEKLLRIQNQREQEISAQLCTIEKQARIEAAELSKANREQERSLHREFTQREHTLNQHRQNLLKKLSRLERDRIEREIEHGKLIHQSRLETEALLHAQIAREQEVTSQLLAIQQQATDEKVYQAASHIEQILKLQKQHAEQEQETSKAMGMLREEGIRNAQAQLDLQVELSKDIQANKEIIAQLEHALSKMKNNLTLIQNSWSWKITAPLRWAERRLCTSNLHFPEVISKKKTSEKQRAVIVKNEISQLNNCSDYLVNTAMSSNPFSGTAFNLESLLAMNDVQFLECAYFTLLKRAPDFEGLNYYLRRLRSGTPKIHILGQLLDSDEARASGGDLPGLRRAVRLYKFTRLPLVIFFPKKIFKFNARKNVANTKIDVGNSFTSKNAILDQNKQDGQPAKVAVTGTVELELDHSLKLLLASSSEVFWAGTQAPLGWMKASSRIYDPKFDYRLPADFHQKFDLVYLTERDLGNIKAWPLVIDEALRLLAPGGKLIIRVSNTALLSNFELKNLIFSWGSMEILFEHTYNAGPCLFAVKNTRLERRPDSLTGFSFGVITDGKRPELLRAFIDSVQKLERSQGQVVEILVCGPDSVKAELDALYNDLVFVRQPDEFQTLGWITKKKNLIVQAASYENLIVAHDRYIISSDFIKNFQNYGGDYSVLVCRQTRLDGRRMPDWVTLGDDWNVTTPATLEYGDWTRHVFINGGIMIAKTEVLKRISWNELLFWGQTEDVELTRRLRAGGYVPRMAREIEVISATMRQGLMDGFDAMPVLNDRHMLPGPNNPNAEFRSPTVGYDRKINFGAKWADATARMGVYIDSTWSVEPDAIVLPSEEYGEITFKLPARPTSGTTVIIKTATADHVLKVLANDVEVSVNRISDDVLLMEIPAEAHALNNITRLHFYTEHKNFVIHNLLVKPPAATLDKRIEGKLSFCVGGTAVDSLGNGWSQPEAWGCWLNDDQAEIIVAAAKSNRDLTIKGYAKAFVRPPAEETIIGVTVNGMACSHFRLKASFEDQQFRFGIPKELLTESGVLEIVFTPQDPCAPIETGLNHDPRRLSMGLVSLEILDEK